MQIGVGRENRVLNRIKKCLLLRRNRKFLILFYSSLLTSSCFFCCNFLFFKKITLPLSPFCPYHSIFFYLYMKLYSLSPLTYSPPHFAPNPFLIPFLFNPFLSYPHSAGFHPMFNFFSPYSSFPVNPVSQSPFPLAYLFLLSAELFLGILEQQKISYMVDILMKM